MHVHCMTRQGCMHAVAAHRAVGTFMQTVRRQRSTSSNRSKRAMCTASDPTGRVRHEHTKQSAQTRNRHPRSTRPAPPMHLPRRPSPRVRIQVQHAPAAPTPMLRSQRGHARPQLKPAATAGTQWGTSMSCPACCWPCAITPPACSRACCSSLSARWRSSSPMLQRSQARAA